MMTRNSENLIFYGIAKILRDSVGFGRNKTNLFSKLKALVDSEKMITWNSEFSLLSMIPYVTVKF